MGNKNSANMEMTPINKGPIAKLKIFYEEPETPKSPVVFSFDSYSEIFQKKKENEGKSNSDQEGESISLPLPVYILHHIGMFLAPKDIISIFLTCRGFYSVSTDNEFWKNYFINFYNVKNDLSSIEDEKEGEEINWRRLFFKRYTRSQDAEYTYRRKFNPLFCKETNRHPAFVFSVLGDKGSGKRTLISKLLKVDKDENRNTYFMTVEIEKGISRIVKVNLQSLEEGKMTPLAKENSGFAVCFDLCSIETYENVKKYVKLAKNVDSKRKKKGRRYNIVIVGILKGDSKERVVEKKEIIKFVKKKKLKGFVEVSSGENLNLFLPFGIMLQKTINRMYSEYDNLSKKNSLFFHYA